MLVREILFIVTIWDTPGLSSQAITSKCTLPLLSLLVLSLWFQYIHQKKNFINISSPLLPFLGRERGKRKVQDQFKALEKERSCEHLDLGLHHSFLLPEPASQMLSERASILSPGHPRALGLWEKLCFLKKARVTHPSSLYHHWPCPYLCWCLLPSLRLFLGLHGIVPWPWHGK